MRAILGVVLCAVLLSAETPLKIEYSCPPEDIESFGLTCAPDDPCAVFLDLSAAEAAGSRLFAVGNLHTATTTLYSVVLSSEDDGKTWTEPVKRKRAAALDQIQFVDFANGFISGESIEPLPRDPFFLLTTDGGKTWREQALFEDSRFGMVSQFWFESRTAGELVFDRGDKSGMKHEVYQSNTGGESWEMERATSDAVKLKAPRHEPTWRIRADAATKTNYVERRGNSGWERVAGFSIHVADCK